MSLKDSPADYPVLRSQVLSTSPIMDLVQFQFQFQDQTLTRQHLQHLSSVAVLAVDDQDRVLMINQYRHPVRMNLWEIPAGLLDVAGESMHEAAQRELAEEADYTASTWHTLVDWLPSPGSTNEAIRVYLATNLSPVHQSQRHDRSGEEAGITVTWVPLAEAVQAAVEGRIRNGAAVVGLTALQAVRGGAAHLRTAQAPWPDHPRHDVAP